MIAQRIVQLLDDRGELQRAERGGLEPEIVFKLAKRIKPDEALGTALRSLGSRERGPLRLDEAVAARRSSV